MQSLHQFLIDFRTRQWNALVAPRYRLINETATHMIFLHPTKGHRKIAKRRLGL
ncbi:hypothetical protein Ga0061061_11729 [Chelatococcus sambhunathii]|uniref:Uncharacterized protein n=1 Tax=Chelatococcus sambhunathii TaxID=363953 RepID=A0ABP2ADR5_9HYPH|nr:hypothetical protein [Chelatococcus sambhunathii]CUA90979.1 hypothetical protein Ga0061061_11729 [Chelatococcus sambhunathii]